MRKDLRQSSQYAKYMKTLGWKVIAIHNSQFTVHSYLYLKKIPLLPFSIIKIQRPVMPLNLQVIDEIAKKHRALFVKVEPDIIKNQNCILKMKNSGYHEDKWPLLPTKTIHINLKLPVNKLWEKLEKDARYAIRKTREYQSVKVPASPSGGSKYQSISEIFYKDFQKHHHGYLPSKKEFMTLVKAFLKNSILLISSIPEAEYSNDTYHHSRIKDEKNIIAGVLILIDDKTAYYYYAFTSRLGRRLFSQYLLVWEAIKMAKKQGCEIFDFEGIYDERFPNKRWLGFTHFKKSFGGREIEYPKPLIKYYYPFLNIFFV